MIKIAICTTDLLDCAELRSVIRQYAIDNHIGIDVRVYNTPDEVLLGKVADIYFVTGGLTTSDKQLLGREIHKRYPNSFIVCIAVDVSEAVVGYRFRAAGCIAKPFKKDDIIPVLDDLRSLVRDTFIIVKTKKENLALKISSIQYINIEGRNLCYHLNDGTQVNGQTLRTAFKNYVQPLADFPNFLKAGSTLIINLDEIERIEGVKIVFKNQKCVYIPSIHQENFEQHWLNYLKQ